MFKPNTAHLQMPLISTLDELSEKARHRLEGSWAGVFRQEVFERIDEKPYAGLYADSPSRPNAPVNIMIGLEILKSGFGWTDEELFDHYLYDVQVRYALGYAHLGPEDFDLRTIYNFRRRLTDHMQTEGANLLEQTFEKITDTQIEAYGLRTGKQRMDSTQVASNIRNMSRLQLLVEILQRVYRMFTLEDQAQYAAVFKPYLKGSSGQYLYRIKGAETADHLERIGTLMQTLVAELATGYQDNPTYQILGRVFGEHFVVEEHRLRPKKGAELRADSLQAPDDPDATYRKKRGEGYVGYVANLTETSDPENDIQLITKLQVEPNTTDDAAMLAEVLPELKERTGVNQMDTDGGYNSPEVDAAMHEHEVIHVQTAMRGAKSDPDRLSLDQFIWKTSPGGQPQQVTCPQGQTVPVTPGRSAERHLAYFDQTMCETCPFQEQCPTTPLKNTPRQALRISQQQVNVARRRQRAAQARASAENLRPAVEASVRSLKHPFRNGKVPVRGQPRVSMVLIASAAMSNLRRIHRYQVAKRAEQKPALAAEKSQNSAVKLPLSASFASLLARLQRFLRRPTLFRPVWAS